MVNLLEKLILEMNGSESVPAYFVRPKLAEGRNPVPCSTTMPMAGYLLGKG